MIDRLLDVVRGTPKERQALQTIDRLKGVPRLSSKNARDLQQAQVLSRRLFIRRISVGLGSTITLTGIGALGYLLTTQDHNRPQPKESPESYEETYIEYLSAFESVVGEDQEAKSVLAFVKERRRRGYLRGDGVFADESGNTATNFYTAIVDPIRHRQIFNNMQGFAEFNHRVVPTRLLLKRVPIDRTWAGVVLAHEGFHAYQWLSGIEPSRPDGFILGEQEAFELEIRLLNNQTSGKLKEVVQRRTSDVEPGKYRSRLSSDDMAEISSLFSPAKSQDEEGIRIPVYIIALNYAVAESRVQNQDEAKKLKTEYIRSVFEGRIPILG